MKTSSSVARCGASSCSAQPGVEGEIGDPLGAASPLDGERRRRRRRPIAPARGQQRHQLVRPAGCGPSRGPARRSATRRRSCRRSAARARSRSGGPRCPRARSSGGWRRARRAPPRRASAGRSADPADALGVEAVDRLVEEQHRRVAEQRGGEPEPLAHAEREAADPPLRDAAPGRRASSTSVHPAARAARCWPPASAGGRRRAGRGGRPLASSSAPTRAADGRARAYGRPSTSALAGVGRVEPEDHPHRRRLAGPVRADEPGHGPGPHGERTGRRRPASRRSACVTPAYLDHGTDRTLRPRRARRPARERSCDVPRARDAARARRPRRE